VRNLITQPPTAGPDTDGDGRPDDVKVAGGTVTITRADGTLTFGQPGHDVALQNHADLDGDGRDDLILNDGGEVYVVSGKSTPGPHSPKDAGVRVDPDLTDPWPVDLSKIAGQDFVVPHRAAGSSTGVQSTTDVYDGAAVLALGPGGDGRGAKPWYRLPGLVRAAVPLAAGARPETLLYVPGTPAEVRIAERPGAILRALGPSHRVEDLIVFDERGVRKIGLQIDERVAIWPVPPLCPSTAGPVSTPDL
jgi:hypothetical protein